MDSSDFCHLHFHTEYSLLDGACRIKESAKLAAEMGMPALAITDHGVLHGAVNHYKACKAEGVKPIIGCEVYVSDGDMKERRKNEDGSQANHLLLLAKDLEGYHNLCKLVSAGHLEGYYYKPRVDMELLNELSGGLIATSGCLKGQVPERILNGNMEGALEMTGTFTDVFGKENYFMEIMDHGLAEQHRVNHGVLEISKKLNLPLVATNDVHYLRHSDYEAHDVMLCLQTGTVMSDPNRLRYHADQFYMKSVDEMAKIFKDHPEAITNTVKVAEMCDLTLKLDKSKAEDLHFPKYVCPEGFDTLSYLLHLVQQGIRDKYGILDVTKPKNPDEEVVFKRYTKECGVIIKTGFLDYFLVVWDFIKYAKSQKIPVGPGRGSGAGSIFAYALDITTIDPLHYDLIFERFLNPERISPPDFDIDFCQYRRGEVIEYVKQKYGHENCAQIITFGTLGAKMVIRDIGRVLEIPLQECDRLAKMVPEDPGMTLEKALEMNPEFKEVCANDPQAKEIMRYARVLEGLPRNQGTHAAGVVIGEKPLTELIPLCRDKEKQAVAQYEMKPLESTGMLKMDFLGLKTLSVIAEAVLNVQENHGIEVDIDNVPLDDEKAIELMNRGDTVGVFQIESKGMRDLLRQFQLSSFKDLIAMIALYRPGPMDMIPDFIARRHERVKIKYDHYLLEPILKETYGVMIYQEQVQQAAFSLAGYSLGEGDILRRAMGKKVPAIMAAQRGQFVSGCKKTNEIDSVKAGKIFDNIEQFAGYGFNKSHSAAYAIISFQTAYLKAHYPIEFMAGLCSCDMSNPDKLAFFIAECEAMGMEVLPPSVNTGGARFKPDGKGIRFGMAGIKGVGDAAVSSLVAERKKDGPFKSLTDFCMRLDSRIANKKALEGLVQAGAFDFTGMARSRLFHGIELVMQRASADLADRLAGQTSLFDMMGAGEEKVAANEVDDIPEVDPWPLRKLLKIEKDLLGFYISGHPLDEFEWELGQFALHDIAKFKEYEPKTTVRVGGVITELRKLFTKRTQEAMAAFAVEGIDASCEAVMFPGAYAAFGSSLELDQPVIVVGEVADEDDAKILVSEAYPLADAHKHFAVKLVLRISGDNEEDLEKLNLVRDAMLSYPGSLKIAICVDYADGRRVVLGTEPRFYVEACFPLMEKLREIIGEDNVELMTLKKPNKREPQKRNFKRTG